MSFRTAQTYSNNERNRIRPFYFGRPFHLEDQGDPCRTGFSCGNGREA